MAKCQPYTALTYASCEPKHEKIRSSVTRSISVFDVTGSYFCGISRGKCLWNAFTAPDTPSSCSIALANSTALSFTCTTHTYSEILVQFSTAGYIPLCHFSSIILQLEIHFISLFYCQISINLLKSLSCYLPSKIVRVVNTLLAHRTEMRQCSI